MNLYIWLYNLIINLFKPKPIIVPKNIVGSVDFNYAPPINYSKADWLPYMSLPYRTQVMPGGTGDEANCATRAAIETIEAILNYYLRNHLFLPIIENFFKNNGYCNENGDVKLSIRYNAKENNTTQQGADVSLVWNNFAKYGVVPESIYPDPSAPFNWNDYYSPVPDDVAMLGEYTANVLFKVLWSVVANDKWSMADIPTLQSKLQNSPLYFASTIGAVDSNSVEQWTGNKDYKHARVLCSVDNYLETLDSYKRNNNYNQKLSLNFPLACLISSQIKII